MFTFRGEIMSFGEHCSDFIQELIVSGVFSMRFVGYLAFYSTFRRNSYLYKYYVIPGIVPVTRCPPLTRDSVLPSRGGFWWVSRVLTVG